MSYDRASIIANLRSKYSPTLRNKKNAPSENEDSPLIHKEKVKKSANPQNLPKSEKTPYDPYLYPSDLKTAIDHGKANRVSIPNYLLEELNSDIEIEKIAVDLCDCCGYPIDNMELPLCCSNTDLIFLGVQFPLFFDFIKWSLGLIFLIFLISGLFNIITNISGNDCNNELEILGKKCISDFFVNLSLLNKSASDKYLQAQEILNFSSVILVIIFLHFFRYKQRKLAFECDIKSITASDYTLEVNNLPIDVEDEEIRKFFESKSNKEMKVNIVKICRTFFISDFLNFSKIEFEFHEKLINEKKNIDYLENEYNNNTDERVKKNIKRKISKKKKNCAIISQRITATQNAIIIQKENFKKENKYTDTVFITFETPAQANFVKNQLKINIIQKIKLAFQKNFNLQNKYLFRGKSLMVSRAPEPNEIKWENLGIQFRIKYQNKFITYFLTGLSLLFSFVLILSTSYLNTYVNENKEITSIIKTIVSISGFVLIIIINNILALLITWLSNFEKNSTDTEYYSSLIEKKTTSQFLNTAVIYIIIAWYDSRFFGTGGLIGNITSVFLSNMIIQPLLFIFSPYYLYTLYKRRQFIKNEENRKIIQQDANKLFEGINFDITLFYSAVLNIMLFGSFYAALLPVSLLLTFITVFIYYWIFKYILLKRSSLPPLLGKEIAYDMVEILEYVPLLLASGDLFFNLIFYSETGTFTIVTLIICILNFILPMRLFNKKIFPYDEKKLFREKDPNYLLNYNEAKYKLNSDYDRSNPITSQKATEEWVNFIENNNKNQANENTIDVPLNKNELPNLRIEKTKKSFSIFLKKK